MSRPNRPHRSSPDDASTHLGMDMRHERVNHSVGEYVRDMVHANRMESFWSMLKRGYQKTLKHFSKKHMNRYVREFARRHNAREFDTPEMMMHVVAGMMGRHLTYKAVKIA